MPDQQIKFYQVGHASRSATACSTPSSARCRRARSARTRSPRATAPARAAARRSAPATCSTPRCAPRDGKLIAANATGCLEVFSTPYPGVVLAAAVDPLAVRQRAGRRHRHRRGAEGQGPRRTSAWSARAATAARSTSASPACPGCSSATTTCSTSATTTRRYMNTGVQRSGATPPAARTATTQAGRRRARQRLRPGQERAADRDGARDPVRRHGDGRRPARPRAQGRARDGVPRRALPARLRALPARLGLGLARHDPDRAAGQGDRALPGLRGRARRGRRASRRSAAGSRSRSTCAPERYAHLFGERPTRRALQAMRRNIALGCSERDGARPATIDAAFGAPARRDHGAA